MIHVGPISIYLMATTKMSEAHCDKMAADILHGIQQSFAVIPKEMPDAVADALRKKGFSVSGAIAIYALITGGVP